MLFHRGEHLFQAHLRPRFDDKAHKQIKGQRAAESDRNGTSRSPVPYGRSLPAIFPRRSAQAERRARSRDFFQFPPGTLPDGRFPAKRQERRRTVRLSASPETLARPPRRRARRGGGASSTRAAMPAASARQTRNWRK